MKTVDFSETIAASDLKVGRNRHLNKFLKVSIEGQGNFLPWPKVVDIQNFKPDFLRSYCADLNQIFMKFFRYKEMKI